MYEILYMPMYALFYYRKAAALRPYDARMWTTLGVCYESLAKWNEAVRVGERVCCCVVMLNVVAFSPSCVVS
jgi:anaphase-promoting complex subunit 8